jgi:4-amino-4-deoxy-L-arabinose transferase-like glycosyltransferase
LARFAWPAAVAGLGCLYLLGLSGIGLIGPDEPRYAAIGREMAVSGDWITPRLWGEPWFEKPALTYWLVAAGLRAGLGPELGPRLPVALVSLAFLLFYCLALGREFGRPAAIQATVILATTAGWLAFSQVAVTDLPMSACFAAAMLVAMRWIGSGSRRALAGAGALLGAAVLAKGLVPLALAAPLAWFGRRRLRQAWIGAAAFLAVAAPWYALCWMRHGRLFVDEFLWRHHVERYASDSLAHQQPWWFYLPVLAAGLFPWTPLVAHLAGRAAIRDWKRQFLAAWVVFGFLFFSLATNKLPGYLLPLVPAVCALLGIVLAEARLLRWTLAASALLLGLLPAVAAVLPEALPAGLASAGWAGAGWVWLLPAAALAAAVWRLSRGAAAPGLLLVALAAAAGFGAVKATVSPRVDQRATARPLWRSISRDPGQVCVGELHRAWRYGLNYYSVTPLPDCQDQPRPVEIRQELGEPPITTLRRR